MSWASPNVKYAMSRPASAAAISWISAEMREKKNGDKARGPLMALLLFRKIPIMNDSLTDEIKRLVNKRDQLLASGRAHTGVSDRGNLYQTGK